MGLVRARRLFAWGTVFVLLLVGCGGEDEPPRVDAVGSASNPGVEHVHGLGIDPENDDLYVATHFGTFRIREEGEADRVGDTFQDTMGFTVAGPGRFLGSGHPDVAGMRAGQPDLLGLIESTDAGATWSSLSLSGEVDFHGLAYAHERVYGWDSTSGRFMVSDDMKTWETRATLDLYSFAVDPLEKTHIVGASSEGLIQSADDGATWSALEGPAMVVLSWDDDAGLWGVEPDGTTYHSGDAGATWQDAGSLPGEPQAFLATVDALWAAASDDDHRTGIYRSEDGGETWELRYRDPEN